MRDRRPAGCGPAMAGVVAGLGGGGGGDGLGGGVPDVAGPGAAGPGRVEVGDGAELAALGVVELAEPVAGDDDAGRGVALAVAAVDGVAAAGQEVVLDGLVRHRRAGAGRVQADRVGLPQAVEDRVVFDGHRLGAAGGDDAVGVVAGDVPGAVNVVALDQPGRDLHGGPEQRDVVVLDDHSGRVAVHVVDGGVDAAGGGVGAADDGILDRDALSVGEGDAERAAGRDLDVVDGDVGGVDDQGAGDGQAAEHRPVPGDGHVVVCSAVGPARSAGDLARDRLQGRAGRDAGVRRARVAAADGVGRAVGQDRRAGRAAVADAGGGNSGGGVAAGGHDRPLSHLLVVLS